VWSAAKKPSIIKEEDDKRGYFFFFEKRTLDYQDQKGIEFQQKTEFLSCHSLLASLYPLRDKSNPM
jgi:hypothetical protein